MFTQNFGSFLCDGDYIECKVEGFTCRATVYFDEDSGAPWEDEGGHGPVSDWTPRSKNPGERELCHAGDCYRYYDFQEACKIARRDGWGSERDENLTGAQKAAKAAERDYEVLKAWCNDKWQYFGIAVTVFRDDVPLTGKYDHALWGLEGNYPDSDNNYFIEKANDLLMEALDAAKEKLQKLCSR